MEQDKQVIAYEQTILRQEYLQMELVSIVTMFNMINLSEDKIYKPTITK